MFKKGEKVIAGFTGEIGVVAQVDKGHEQLEVEYPDGSYRVIGFSNVRRVEDK
ncbi:MULTISPECIES: hypothetical protein [Bacillus]|uniref:hypothetical protein n=1 Tax=Bacillus TaxID=1386 RepID=UPI00039B52C3|nr:MULTISPECIES: hypothetical protein [Bacillus]AHZ16069.1 hypothetical protein V529_20430 [Bacillus velezensis SQR9]ASZ03888.1 hypothetical protein CJP14_08435 [Bacillus velezensis]ATX84227.1 hypothetical protein CU084_11300 [Bacillus velezensis]MBN7742763.1 hypothetical protein [Bacillus velezensis]MCB5334875.1 hypothetical protein [Bacillus amyloliquefaciens]